MDDGRTCLTKPDIRAAAQEKIGKQEGLYSYNWRPSASRLLHTQGLQVAMKQMTIKSISNTLGWNNPSSCVKQRESFGCLSTAAIMSPSLAAVSTVRERRAFTSSIAVYSSCLTQTMLQLLKRISVLVLSSTGTGTSTSTSSSSSTSTRLLQVPRISSMLPCSLCVYFTVIRSQHSAAVHCCL